MIDTHLHLFEHGFAGNEPSGAELAAYEQVRSRHQVTAGLVVGYEGEPRFAGNNAYVCAVARDRDWIVPLVHLDPGDLIADPASPTRWRESGAAGWVGYVLGDQQAQQWADLPEAVWSALDVPVPWSLNIDPAALAVLTPRLARLRNVTVLVSHLGLPGRAAGSTAERLAPVVEAVRTVPRLRVKLSGLYALAGPGESAPFPSATPYLRHLRDTVGIEHLVWGSDFSPLLARQDVASQVDLSAYAVFTPGELAVLASDDLTRVGCPARPWRS